MACPFLLVPLFYLGRAEQLFARPTGSLRKVIIGWAFPQKCRFCSKRHTKTGFKTQASRGSKWKEGVRHWEYQVQFSFEFREKNIKVGSRWTMTMDASVSSSVPCLLQLRRCARKSMGRTFCPELRPTTRENQPAGRQMQLQQFDLSRHLHPS